ncbi:MAG: hypothetical protein PUD59_00135 [bacterium]|nr:hypothetical protein [bacterium]
MDSVNFFTKILRPFLAAIDYLIFSLIGSILEGIFNLSNLTVNTGLIQVIYRRIYVVLGIFMVFKLTFSFVNYLISPDKMTDKEQGVGKIVSRTVIMLALLILLPIVLFNDTLLGYKTDPNTGEEKPRGTLLNVLQNGVIKTIPKIVLGVDDDVNSVEDNVASNGEYMATMMLRAFFYPRECISNNSNDCDMEKSSVTLDNFVEEASARNDTYFNYHYMWPLTTISGILMVIILLGMAIDVAIRAFKLIILQMIAPVPIMSYIDPKSSKDGAFSHWLKSFGSTYIEIFTKLGAIYLLLLLIDRMFKSGDNGLFGTSYSSLGKLSKSFVFVFLAIGLFKFVKDAPKFIKDALGMKDSGGSMFGGLSTLGAAAGAIGGAAAGVIGGFAGGYAASNAAGGNRGKNLLSAVGGGLAGLGRGGIQGAKGASKGNLIKGMSGAISAQGALNARKIGTVAEGSTWSGRMSARAGEFFRGKTAADRDKYSIDNYKGAIEGAKEFKNVLADSARKSNVLIGEKNIKQRSALISAASAGDANALNSLINDYGYKDLSDAIAQTDQFEKDWQKLYFAEVEAGRINDGDAEAVMSAKSVADASIRTLNLKDSSNKLITEVRADNAGKVIGIATSESNKIKSSDKYKSRKADADAIKRNGK